MSQVALPFFTLDGDAVSADNWTVSDGERQIQVEQGWLSGWDYARNLTLERRVRVDLEAAAAQLQLSETDLDLQLALRIATGPGSMPRLVLSSTAQAVGRDGGSLLLRETVEGNRLSSRLRAECHLLLGKCPSAGSALSPMIACARLWNDEFELRLEGEEPRFPMEFISFSERFAGRPENYALWYLHWQPGHPERDFGGAVRLYVNSDRADFAERLLQQDRATLQTMLADIMHQVVGDYLDQHASDLLPGAGEEGSTGAQARFWLELAFPGQHLAQVQSMRQRKPGTYNAALLAAADVAADGNQS